MRPGPCAPLTRSWARRSAPTCPRALACGCSRCSPKGSAPRSSDAADLLRIAELRLAASSPIAPEMLVAAATEAGRLCLHDRAVRLAAAAEARGAGPEATVIRAHALSALGRHHEAARALARIDSRCSQRSLAASALAVEVGAADLRAHRFATVMERLDGAAEWHAGDEWARTVATLRTAVLVRAGRYREAIELGYAAGSSRRQRRRRTPWRPASRSARSCPRPARRGAFFRRAPRGP